MKLITNLTEFDNDLKDEIRLFFPLTDFIDEKITITHRCTIEGQNVTNSCQIYKDDKMLGEATNSNIMPPKASSLYKTKLLKRFAKNCMYEALSKWQNKSMPWGTLTGIRPTRLAYDLIEDGTPSHLIKETLIKSFYVSEKKAEIVAKILKNQNCIIKNDNLVDIYINIPFCPTRCSYCSFISSEFDKVAKRIPDYVACLIKEIREMKKLIFNKALVVRTIYFGGGTPTTLSAEHLSMILDELSYPVTEFTVECGRPDTITKEKLDVLKAHGVTRICINPQTFNDKTLKLIGRNHTTKDIISAYALAINYDFTINMDIIAGLPGEKFSHFKKTIDSVLELAPQNITIHTLALKNGAILKDSKIPDTSSQDIEKMVDYGYKKMCENDYAPYYMYRQKSMIGNLENIGYAQPKTVCLFNIDTMEETCSVLACGAGAISKRIFNLEHRIERSANVKLIDDYISRIDEMIERKNKLFS